MKVLELVMVESNNAATTNQAKSRRSVEGRAATPNPAIDAIARGVRACRKKKNGGEYQSGRGFSSRSLRNKRCRMLENVGEPGAYGSTGFASIDRGRTWVK